MRYEVLDKETPKVEVFSQSSDISDIMYLKNLYGKYFFHESDLLQVSKSLPDVFNITNVETRYFFGLWSTSKGHLPKIMASYEFRYGNFTDSSKHMRLSINYKKTYDSIAQLTNYIESREAYFPTRKGWGSSYSNVQDSSYYLCYFLCERLKYLCALSSTSPSETVVNEYRVLLGFLNHVITSTKYLSFSGEFIDQLRCVYGKTKQIEYRTRDYLERKTIAENLLEIASLLGQFKEDLAVYLCRSFTNVDLPESLRYENLVRRDLPHVDVFYKTKPGKIIEASVKGGLELTQLLGEGDAEIISDFVPKDCLDELSASYIQLVKSLALFSRFSTYIEKLSKYIIREGESKFESPGAQLTLLKIYFQITNLFLSEVSTSINAISADSELAIYHIDRFSKRFKINLHGAMPIKKVLDDGIVFALEKINKLKSKTLVSTENLDDSSQMLSRNNELLEETVWWIDRLEDDGFITSQKAVSLDRQLTNSLSGASSPRNGFEDNEECHNFIVATRDKLNAIYEYFDNEAQKREFERKLGQIYREAHELAPDFIKKIGLIGKQTHQVDNEINKLQAKVDSGAVIYERDCVNLKRKLNILASLISTAWYHDYKITNYASIDDFIAGGYSPVVLNKHCGELAKKICETEKYQAISNSLDMSPFKIKYKLEKAICRVGMHIPSLLKDSLQSFPGHLADIDTPIMDYYKKRFDEVTFNVRPNGKPDAPELTETELFNICWELVNTDLYKNKISCIELLYRHLANKDYILRYGGGSIIDDESFKNKKYPRHIALILSKLKKEVLSKKNISLWALDSVICSIFSIASEAESTIPSYIGLFKPRDLSTQKIYFTINEAKRISNTNNVGVGFDETDYHSDSNTTCSLNSNM